MAEKVRFLIRRINKLLSVFERILVKGIVFFDVDLYVSQYTKYLKKQGIDFFGEKGTVKMIETSAYFDGTDYSLIHIGDNATISRNVVFLTHDYSLNTALASIGLAVGRHEGEYHFRRQIRVGNNVFIGAGATLLGGAEIGDNCIIGACSVVKGKIPSGSIVVGNPCKIIGKTEDYARKHLEKGDYLREGISLDNKT